MRRVPLGLLLFLLCVLTCACGRRTAPAPAAEQSTGNLLAGREPAALSGARGTERLTDGTAAIDGDHWRTDLTATLSGPDAWVQYDLGKEVRIRAAYLQADNNDRYLVSISSDGKVFKPLWNAPPSGRAGMRPRSNGHLDKTGRYLRLSASGGDGSYALSELAVYAERPKSFPPRFAARPGIRAEEGLRTTMIWFGVALGAFVILTSRRLPRWANWLLGAIPIAALVMLYHGLDELWPVEQREVSMLRATVAAVALVAVLREALAPRFWPAERRAVLATLGLTGVMALACFFNLGRPQFWDAKQNKPSVIHNYDMRVYFPVAKYFDELDFDGLYLASVGAFFDDVPGASARNYGHVELRDLKTHRTKRVSEVVGEIEAVKRRFSPERWQEFKRDMRYFRETMGLSAYLGTLTDHGGNATPVWFTIGHLLFAHADASNTTLLLGGLLDPILLLGAFVAVGFCFGWRTAFVSATVFGANDFYMFGSNWAGATLRHDWMAALAFGACALKRERWALGGVCFAYSALIRAFPALALAGMTLPAAWWLYDHRRRHDAWPALQLIRERHRPLLIVLGSAAVFAVVMVIVSSILLGPSAWPTWLHKVSLLDRGAHVNHVSLRALIGYHPDDVVLRSRASLMLVAAVTYGALVIRAARDRRLEQAAILGLFLVPAVFNPANYYIHLVFVFPLLVIERLDRDQKPLTISSALIWASLLAICTAQYQTVLEPRLNRHFYQAALILFVGLVAILLIMIRENMVTRRGKRLATPAGALEPPLLESDTPAPDDLPEPSAGGGSADSAAPEAPGSDPAPEAALAGGERDSGAGADAEGRDDSAPPADSADSGEAARPASAK